MWTDCHINFCEHKHLAGRCSDKTEQIKNTNVSMTEKKIRSWKKNCPKLKFKRKILTENFTCSLAHHSTKYIQLELACLGTK